MELSGCGDCWLAFVTVCDDFGYGMVKLHSKGSSLLGEVCGLVGRHLEFCS